ncbi:unnamed protein product [Durusdinium trenchii]|uniref:Helicase ATP-binding domain-containing protein n=1 Tax=Durusdinium trenchii TaxID=1381693 RepID=A0ABP0J444_9DINO
MGTASSVEGENCCSVQLRNQARPGECEEALPIWLTEGEIFPECETFRQGIGCLRSQAAPEAGGQPSCPTGSEALAVETLPASHAQLPKEACGSSTDASSKSPDQVLVPDDPVNGTSGELPTVAANAEAKSSSEQEPTLREDEKASPAPTEPASDAPALDAEKVQEELALRNDEASLANEELNEMPPEEDWPTHKKKFEAKTNEAKSDVRTEALKDSLEKALSNCKAYWKELQLPAEQIILNEVQKMRPRTLDPKIMTEVKRALRNLEGALEDCATSEESELEIHKKIIQEIENVALLPCLFKHLKDKEWMVKEVLDIKEKWLGKDYVGTLNTKTDLAVLLQELDKKEEAEQKLREVLTTMQAKNDKLVGKFPEAGSRSSAQDSQTIGGSSTSERVKENFALHFVMDGQASVIDKTGDIAFEGNIRRGAKFCIISFPGKFASGWDALVAALHGESVACVFLTTPETGLGKHKDDGSGKCWCSQIYGERNFKQFGYLVVMKDPDPEKLKQALENAKCTHAIVVPFDATPEERKAYEEEAKKAWEKYGKVASWGCEWFVVWMEQVKKAVQLGQRLQVVFFPGQRGQGKVAWDELSFRDLWDGVGCGGSQKAEIAYVEAMRMMEGDTWDYDEIDVKRFLFQEFPPNCKVFAEDPTDGNSWREGTMVLTMPDSQSSETLSRVWEPKWIVKCDKTNKLFASKHVRHFENPLKQVAEQAGLQETLKSVLQEMERSSEEIQVQAPVQSHLRDGTPSLMFQVTTEKVQIAQALRNKVLSGALDLALSKKHSAFAKIHVDQSDFLERYEKSLLTLSKLTDHQEQKLQNLKQLGENLHLTAPAGCGKTFVAIQYALDELKLDDENSSGQMLFVSPHISLGLYFVRWLAVRHSTLTELSIHDAMNLIMKRIVLLQKPYEDLVTLQIEGNKIIQNKGEKVHTQDFLLAVFDECHELVREGFGHILDKINAKKKLLLSDQSQCSSLNLDEKYPGYRKESLSEIVRSTRRLVKGASAFQIGETQEVSSIGPDGPALKTFIFEKSEEDDVNMYCDYTLNALSHLIKVYPGLRSLHGRLALLVPDQHFLEQIKVRLQEQLKVRFRHKRFHLVSFEESLSFVPTKFVEGQEELILLDTIDNARGHEHLMVVCIALDEEIQGKAAEVDLTTRAKLYVGITRAQHLAIVVNKYIAGGWLEFLATLKFKKAESERGKEYRSDAAAKVLSDDVPPASAPHLNQDDESRAADLQQDAKEPGSRAASHSRPEQETLQSEVVEQAQAPEAEQEQPTRFTSIWDTTDNKIEGEIGQLKFDPIVTSSSRSAGWFEAWRASRGDPASSTRADEYEVLLDQTNGTRMGIDMLAGGKTLIIQGIDSGGLVEEWNESSPHLEVKKNHLIMEVNGVRGSARKMMEECVKDQELHLRVLMVNEDDPWSNKHYVLAQIGRGVSFLEQASLELRDDPDVILAAVLQDPFEALRLASEDLRMDANYVKELVRQSKAPWLLKLPGLEHFRDDTAFVERCEKGAGTGLVFTYYDSSTCFMKMRKHFKAINVSVPGGDARDQVVEKLMNEGPQGIATVWFGDEHVFGAYADESKWMHPPHECGRDQVAVPPESERIGMWSCHVQSQKGDFWPATGSKYNCWCCHWLRRVRDAQADGAVICCATSNIYNSDWVERYTAGSSELSDERADQWQLHRERFRNGRPVEWGKGRIHVSSGQDFAREARIHPRIGVPMGDGCLWERSILDGLNVAVPAFFMP